MESRYAAVKLSGTDVVGPECVQCGTVWTTCWRHDAAGHYLCAACAAGFYQHKVDEFGRLLQTRSAPVAGKQLLNLPAVSITHTTVSYTLYTCCTVNSPLEKDKQGIFVLYSGL